MEQLESRALLSATTDLTGSAVRAIGRFQTFDAAAAVATATTPAAPEAIVQPASAALMAVAADDHGGHGEQGDSDHGSIHANDPTAPFIHVQHDTIPNFVQNPTITTIRSGNWSDPRIWSAQRVPRYGDVIQISSGTTVEYSARSFTSYKAIGVNPGATLRFNTKVNTRMPVGTLIVFEGGSLQIGTPIYPVSHSVKAEILFDGIWLDKASDPSQYGVGLLGFGEVSVYGGYKSRTWLRLANEAKVGDTYLTLETKPGGWQPGETLFLPDSRQIPAHMVNYIDNGLDGIFNPTWEEVTIDRVVGNRVYLRAPLAYNHRGATNENGEIEFLPHVAVLERTVVFRSAKPALARGHVMLAGRADVDVRYAQFTDLGRTDAMSPLDSTTRDQHGNVTHVGTNQIGRYSVHIHHLVGPSNATNTGYQFQFIGNTIDNGLKWGLAIHGSSYGLIQDNITYKLQGSGFVTEDGSEIENDFYRNFAARIRGTNDETVVGSDTGRSGAGFWFRRAGNTLRENVAVNNSFAGVVINGSDSNDLPKPAFRGAIVSEPGESISLGYNPPTSVKNTEIYGRTRHGLWLAWPTGDTTNSANLTVRGLRVWHTDGSGVEGYRLRGLTVADSVILGSTSALSIAPWSTHRRETVGIKMHRYETSDVRIVNTRIANQVVGIDTGEATNSRVASGTPAAPMRIENVTLANATNIVIPTLKAFQQLYQGKAVEIVDTLFRPINTSGMINLPPKQLDIEMEFASDRLIPTRDLMAPDIVTVRNFNRVPGDDFRVYYFEQRADFVPPTAALGFGSPVPGMSNEQLWNRFGTALAGSVAPCSTIREGIAGFACPLTQSLAASDQAPQTASSLTALATELVDVAVEELY